MSYGQNEIFDEANKLYNDGSYVKAIKKYESLLQKELSSENIHYNLANAYYQTDQVAWSILYFEKALKLNPRSKQIQHNLRLAYLKTKNHIEPLPRLLIISWWYSFLNKNNASQWGKRAILFTFIGFILLMLYKLYQRAYLKWLASISLIFAISFIFLAKRKYQYDYQHNFAILMKSEALLKETPNETSKTIFTAYEGLKLEIIDHVDDWSQILLEDSSKAWILSIYLEEI
jgi:tetratricopeptide (TPR) repeat protein